MVIAIGAGLIFSCWPAGARSSIAAAELRDLSVGEYVALSIRVLEATSEEWDRLLDEVERAKSDLELPIVGDRIQRRVAAVCQGEGLTVDAYIAYASSHARQLRRYLKANSDERAALECLRQAIGEKMDVFEARRDEVAKLRRTEPATKAGPSAGATTVQEGSWPPAESEGIVISVDGVRGEAVAQGTSSPENEARRTLFDLMFPGGCGLGVVGGLAGALVFMVGLQLLARRSSTRR